MGGLILWYCHHLDGGRCGFIFSLSAEPKMEETKLVRIVITTDSSNNQHLLIEPISDISIISIIKIQSIENLIYLMATQSSQIFHVSRVILIH